MLLGKYLERKGIYIIEFFFSLGMKSTPIRILSSIVASENLPFVRTDVKITDPDEEIYMYQSGEFVIPVKEHLSYKLNRGTKNLISLWA